MTDDNLPPLPEPGQISGAPMASYSPEDQAFFRFWYGHMLGDLMQPPLVDVRHTTARYIWDAAILAERERFRAMFDEALADHGITWPGEVDILYEKMFPAAAIREGVK